MTALVWGNSSIDAASVREVCSNSARDVQQTGALARGHRRLRQNSVDCVADSGDSVGACAKRARSCDGRAGHVHGSCVTMATARRQLDRGCLASVLTFSGDLEVIQGYGGTPGAEAAYWTF
ncbi:hypothetical protein U1Q18_029063 [Sarracenia purpurea var. burkii]